MLTVPYYEETLKNLTRNRTCVATIAPQTNTFIGDFESIDKTRRRYKTKQQLLQLEAALEMLSEVAAKAKGQ